MPPTPPWSRPPDELLAELGSRAAGLTSAEAAERLARLGPNALEVRRRAPWLDVLTHQLRNPMSWLLVFAAIVSSVAGEVTDAVVITFVIALSAALDGWQQHRASQALEKLRTRIALRCDVLRDGALREVPTSEVVPGDVVSLAAGSLVPADGVVLEAKDLQLAEAILTGETFPVEKEPGTSAPDAPLGARRNALFLGTSVRSGTGKLLVTTPARESEYGRIAKTLALRPPETDFDRGLRRFGYLLTRIMIALVVFTFTATVLTRQPAVESLLFAIALAVGLAPEMLPAIVAVNLSRGARRMAERGVLVRRLSAIESFGSMDVLCTDKTGTLTRGDVVLEAALSPDGAPSARVLQLAVVNAALETGLANAMDAAIRARAGADASAEGWEKLDELPYDFVRRRLGIVARAPDGQVLLVEKGSLATVLEVCRAARNGEGEVPLDDDARGRVLARGRELGAAGLRTLGVATRRLAAADRYDLRDERELAFEGILTFVDPAKPGVDEVLRDLARLGVGVKMITGDAREVAVHLAASVGLEAEHVLTGRELSRMRDEALCSVAPETTIFAEVDPNQKERIVRALGKRGHVVGYMGDGINDAPALHAADVSVSVDGAVDVAREAADFVLLSQDLAVLRDGVLEGRTTFANTMKYVYTTESANFGNMVSMAAAAAFLPFLPLLAGQILLNNFLSDIPAVTLASDAVDPELVERPQRWDLRALSRFMVWFGLVSSCFDLLAFAGLYLLLEQGAESFRTGWFVTSVLTELAVALVVRTRRAAWRSRPSAALLWSSVTVAVVAVALPYTPLGTVFQLVPMPPSVLALITAVTVGYVLAAEASKRVFFARASA
ncbi:MAG: magnesium-translocating P-type ATPase [Sandaracinaceae bacterium]|nr:magnesium-translocating P-type ATPase [Sandaracinaceae bacterium]